MSASNKAPREYGEVFSQWASAVGFDVELCTEDVLGLVELVVCPKATGPFGRVDRSIVGCNARRPKSGIGGRVVRLHRRDERWQGSSREGGLGAGFIRFCTD